MDPKDATPKIHLGAPVSPKPPPPRPGTPASSFPFVASPANASYDLVQRPKAQSVTAFHGIADYPPTTVSSASRTTATSALTFATSNKTVATSSALAVTKTATSVQQVRPRTTQVTTAGASAAALDSVLGLPVSITSRQPQVSSPRTSGSMASTSSVSTNRATANTTPTPFLSAQLNSFPTQTTPLGSSLRNRSPAPARTVTVSPVVATPVNTALALNSRTVTATPVYTARSTFSTPSTVTSGTPARQTATVTSTSTPSRQQQAATTLNSVTSTRVTNTPVPASTVMANSATNRSRSPSSRATPDVMMGPPAGSMSGTVPPPSNGYALTETPVFGQRVSPAFSSTVLTSTSSAHLQSTTNITSTTTSASFPLNNSFPSHTATLHASTTASISQSTAATFTPNPAMGSAVIRGRSPAPRAPPTDLAFPMDGGASSVRGRSPAPTRPPTVDPSASDTERGRSPAARLSGETVVPEPERGRSPAPRLTQEDGDGSGRGRSPAPRATLALDSVTSLANTAEPVSTPVAIPPAVASLGLPADGIIRTRQRSADFTPMMSPSDRSRSPWESGTSSAPVSPLFPAMTTTVSPPPVAFPASALPAAVSNSHTTTTTPTPTSFVTLASAAMRKLSPAPPNRNQGEEPKRSRSPAPPSRNPDNNAGRRGSEGGLPPPTHAHSLSICAEMLSPRQKNLDTPRRASIPTFSGSPRPFVTHGPAIVPPLLSLNPLPDPSTAHPSSLPQPDVMAWHPQARFTPRARFGDPVEAWLGIDAVRLRYISAIPRVLVNLRAHLISNNGLHFVGVFRLSPDATVCNSIREQINNGTFEWDSCDDVVITSSLLKQWFGTLPDKKKLLDQLDPEHIPVDDISKERAGSLIESLQEPMRSIAMWLLDFCVLVSSHSEDNKMTAGNLAICMAPNLTSCEDFQIVRRKFTQLWQVAITWRQGEFHPYYHQSLSQTLVRLHLRSLYKGTREQHEIKRSPEVKEWLCRFSVLVRSSLDVEHMMMLITLETFGLIMELLHNFYIAKSLHKKEPDIRGYVESLEQLWQFLGPFAQDSVTPPDVGTPALPFSPPPPLPTTWARRNSVPLSLEDMPPIPNPATMPSLPGLFYSPLLSTAPFLVLRRTVFRVSPSGLEDFAPELRRENWPQLKNALHVANVVGDVATRLFLARKTEFSEHFPHLETAFSFCRYSIWADLQQQKIVDLEQISDVELEDAKLEGQLWRKIGILGKSRGGSFKKNPFWFRLTDDSLMLCNATNHDQILEVIHLGNVVECKPLKVGKPIPVGQEKFTLTCKNEKGGTVDFLFLASLELYEKLCDGHSRHSFY